MNEPTILLNVNCPWPRCREISIALSLNKEVVSKCPKCGRLIKYSCQAKNLADVLTKNNAVKIFRA